MAPTPGCRRLSPASRGCRNPIRPTRCSALAAASGDSTLSSRCRRYALSVWQASHPLRIERGRPQCDVGAVAQGHRHLSAGAVDPDVTEELHAGRRRQVLLVSPGALMNFTSGPKVLSSSLGPNVPACSGPETNSQNGSKSWNCALSGIVVMRGGVMHVRRQPHRVDDARVLMKRRMSAISSSRPRGGPSPCANASEPFLLAASS